MLPRFRPALALLLAASAALTAPAPLSAAAAPFAHLRLQQTTLELATVADGFDAPFDLAWGPDGHLWCTQLDGTVWRIDPATGEKRTVLQLSDVFHRKSHGLLSLAFLPQFTTTLYVYLHYVYQIPTRGMDETVRSRLVRCRWDGVKLGEPEVLFDDIPGKSFHNGSRLVFGPDEKLYLSIGDVGDTRGSLDPAKLSGKILRFNADGTVPADNPFPGSPVWSLGHRNVQGLAFAADGRLYASDHGANNDDEINLIARGRSYGWPVIEGFADRPGEIEAARGRDFTDPLRAWTPTIAASGLAHYNHIAIPEWRGALLLANLKGRALRVLPLSADGEKVTSEHIYFQLKLGRVRAVCVSPVGDVYLLTSNTDWHPRFQPWMYPGLPTGPDRIVRLHPTKSAAPADAWTEDAEPLPLLTEDWSFPSAAEHLKAGQDLYAVHCAPCHRPDGTGAPGLIPPLTNTEWVKNKNRLIQVVLGGLSGRIEVNGEFYEQEMPGFRHLSDDDLAAILTYVRASYDNNSNAVIPGEVFEERKGLK